MGIISWLQGIWEALWFAGFLFVESNANSESLFMLLLSAVLSYYPSSLYKHMFYFQARVEQSVSFLLLPSFSSYYGARPKNKPYRIARRFANQYAQLGAPKTHAPLVPQAQAGLTHHPPVPGVQVPVQTWTPSPHSWVPDSVWCKDLHHLRLQSVGPERAGSMTREQQVFPMPYPSMCSGRPVLNRPDREKV